MAPLAHEARARLFDFEVEENVPAAEGVFAMRLRSGVASELRPGQFMNFAVPGDPSQMLRVPLSFSRSDGERVWIEYAVVGDGTRRLAAMAPGESSSLVGPCGNGWRLPEPRAGRGLVVSGGIGLPPVYAAARMLAGAGLAVDAVVAARTGAMLVRHLIDDLLAVAGQVVIVTDDGSAGRAGFVMGPAAELLAAGAYDCVYTCGPTPMMAGVAREAERAGVACQASLERMMGCGFGACSCCNVLMRDGSFASCCMDGPVFDAREVAW